MRGVAAIEHRQPGIACQPDVFALGIDRDGVVLEILADHLGDAGEPVVAGCGKFQRRAIGARQREAHMRKGDRHPLDDLGDRAGLGLLGLEEFQPRRRREEQVAHLDDRAGIGGARPQIGHLAAGHRDLGAIGGIARTAGDRQLGDRTDRRQRLATKAERADIVEAIVELRGAVPTHGQFEIAAPCPSRCR
jgi:hypothetical protein